MSDFLDEFFGGSIGNPSGFIAGAQDLGLSATAALNAYRDAGGAIRTQSWYRAWGEVSAGFADRQTLQGAPWDALPDQNMISTWTTTTGRGYIYHFGLTLEDRETGLMRTQLASLKSDDLITIGDAWDDLSGIYSDAAAEYGERLIGGVPLNVFELERPIV